MGVRSYQWTAEEAAEIDRARVRFEIAADAEMAAMGYRPGCGLPFDGMPAELFPPHPDEDDPRWVDEDDYPDPDPDHPFGGDAGSACPEGTDAIGQIVDSLERVERDIASLMGHRATLFEQARVLGETGTARTRAGSRQLAQRSLRAELGTALRIPERTIEALLGVSRSLVQQLPATLDALREGSISYRHAQVMVDHAADLPNEARRVFEGQAMPHAKRLTASKFNQKARMLREHLHPESITERHVRAREDRDVRLDPQRDGMALLSQFLPAPDAAVIFNQLTDAAISLQSPTELRTLAQLRADIFSTVLLDGDDGGGDGGDSGDDQFGGNNGGNVSDATLGGSGNGNGNGNGGNSDRGIGGGISGGTGGGESGDRSSSRSVLGWDRLDTPGTGSIRDRYFAIRPRLSVTVPALVLLGLSEQPGSLDGYGPIDPTTAKQLAAGAPNMIRLLTHPETGAILSIGRDRYRVPADLRNFLRIRDETCRFPGCSRQAQLCDIDHTLQWQHQHPTAHYNLAHLCPQHHTIKDETDWKVAHTADGTGALEWTSPTGRRHLTEPAATIQSGIDDNVRRRLANRHRSDGSESASAESASVESASAESATRASADSAVDGVREGPA